MQAKVDDQRFMIFAQVQEYRGDYKAWMALQCAEEWRILVRLEFHGSHPGLHVHDWCGFNDVPTGAKSINAPHRRPSVHAYHRQCEAPNRAEFWQLALDLFRVLSSRPEQQELL